jgi:hypothetical protein
VIEQLLVREPECGREAMARVAMDSSPQASLHVAYRAGADTGSSWCPGLRTRIIGSKPQAADQPSGPMLEEGEHGVGTRPAKQAHD